MKRWMIILVLFTMLVSFARADEHIIVSGGPALRYFEHYKQSSHDKFWGNFITTAEFKIKKIKPSLPEGDRITWMVYRPGYESRGKEEKEDLIGDITQRAKELGIALLWFNNRQEFLDYLNSNREDGNKISRLEFFGHSNKRNWMFDYSNKVDGGSTEPAMFHIWNFKDLDRGIFAKNAICKSWGCHSGEQYSSAWYRHTGRRMIGAVGKTDYSSGELPSLSTSGGKWTQ